jgi:hypothetical protein
MASYGPGTAGSSAVSVRLIARFQRKYQAFRDQPLCCDMLCEAVPSEHAGLHQWSGCARGGLAIIEALLADGWKLILIATRARRLRTISSGRPVGKGPRSARSRHGRSTHHPFGSDAKDSGFDVASPELGFRRLGGISYVNSYYCERLDCPHNSLKLRLNNIFHNIPYANQRYRALNRGVRLPPVLGFPP